jgi:putative DNA primase/helicase
LKDPSEVDPTSASKPVAMVLARLENVAKISAGWVARCPAHNDSVNSLSVGEGDDGRALLHCHAGCSFEDVVAALGITVRSLFTKRKGTR